MDWDEISTRLSALTVRELREIGRRHFAGSLGGASAKYELVQAMVTQMRYWSRLESESAKSKLQAALQEIGA